MEAINNSTTTDSDPEFKKLDLISNCPLKLTTGDESDEYSSFPVKIATSPTLGRYLVARRDLKAGELILREEPIFVSPNSGDNTCFGCCLKAKNPRPCSTCGWPVCGKECEQIPFHSRNECLIFSSAGITPPLQPPYDFIHPAELIKVLRAVLISKGRTAEDAATWSAMTKLESHMEQREAIPKVKFMSTLTKNFIRGACHVGDVPEEKIDLILGIIDVNAFRHTLHPNNPLRMEAVKANKDVDRNATFLYPKGAMAAHGCRRTVRWETLPSGTLEMYVTEDTAALSLLTHPYVDLMKGTPERRRMLRDQFYFDCSCPRCSDRTELGTHFSTLKCPTCLEGNLLPDHPLHYKSPWTCASCQATKSSNYERNVVRGMQAEMKSVLEQCSGNNLAVVAGLAKLLGKYRGKICHPNHFVVVDVEYHLVRRMALMRKPTVDLLLEMKKLIHKYLDIAVVFYPGIK